LSHYIGKYCALSFRVPGVDDPLTAEDVKLNLSGTRASGSWLEKPADDFAVFWVNFVRLGICVPSTCTDDEVRLTLDKCK